MINYIKHEKLPHISILSGSKPILQLTFHDHKQDLSMAQLHLQFHFLCFQYPAEKLQTFLLS